MSTNARAGIVRAGLGKVPTPMSQHPLIHPPTAHRRRISRKRPGSALIFIVSILVLLGLLGTAWMSLTRTDRLASFNNIANIQVDLLVDGMKELTVGTIVNGAYGTRDGDPTSYYRPRSDSAHTYSYNHNN